MDEQYDDKLMTDHDYDGIQELDNDLPQWWVWLFYATIIWAVIYTAYYHVFGIGYGSSDEYRLELNPSYERQRSGELFFGMLAEYRTPYFDPDRVNWRQPEAAGVVFVEEKREADTTTYIALTEPADLQAGKAIFISKCATCHGQLGEGGIGPNLTDTYWLHGAGISNVAKTVKYGVPTKGMISWRYELKAEQIVQVASFVTTLQGTNPPNPKPPQGVLIEE